MFAGGPAFAVLQPVAHPRAVADLIPVEAALVV